MANLPMISLVVGIACLLGMVGYSRGLAVSSWLGHRHETIESNYRTAINAAKEAEDNRNYSLAEQKYGEALTYRKNDAPAKQGQERVGLLVVADRNYDQAMKAAKEAEHNRNYSLAEQKYGEALTYRKNDALAKQGQERVGLLVVADRNYDQAMKEGHAAMERTDFPRAVTEFVTAENLAARLNDTDRLTNAQIRKSFAARLRDARDSLVKNDFEKSFQSATNALSLIPADEAGPAVGVALLAATNACDTAIKEKDSNRATGWLARTKNLGATDGIVIALQKRIEAITAQSFVSQKQPLPLRATNNVANPGQAELAKLDTILETYEVQFRVRPAASNIVDSGGTPLEPLPLRFIPLDQKDRIFNALKKLESSYRAAGRLGDREQRLNILRERIKKW